MRKYIVIGEFPYDGEFEEEYDSLNKAKRLARMAVAEGGWAMVFDAEKDEEIEF